jgi:hypothetical protein
MPFTRNRPDVRASGVRLAAAYPSVCPRKLSVVDQSDAHYCVVLFSDPEEAELFKRRASGVPFDPNDLRNDRRLWMRPDR